MRLAICIAAALTASASRLPANAADPKLSVCVFHTGEDSAGKQLAYGVREALRASNGYRLGEPQDCVLQLRLITLNPDDRSSSNAWTAAAVSYTMANLFPYEKGNPQTWYPIHMTTQVLITGTQRVDEQAKAVMATLDDQVQKYRQEAKKGQ